VPLNLLTETTAHTTRQNGGETGKRQTSSCGSA